MSFIKYTSNLKVYTIIIPKDSIFCNPFISNDVDVAIELNRNGNIFSKELVTALTDIKLDTENLLKEDSEIAAIIYFANGETVWEIAKHYGTSAQLICNLNGLENSDCVCNKKLLIPIV